MKYEYAIYEIRIFRDLTLFLFRYGFITFETQEDAQKILQEVSNVPFQMISFTMDAKYLWFSDSLLLTYMDW